MNCYCWYTERFTRWTQLSSEFLEIQLQLGASEANKLITGLHYHIYDPPVWCQNTRLWSLCFDYQAQGEADKTHGQFWYQDSRHWPLTMIRHFDHIKCISLRTLSIISIAVWRRHWRVLAEFHVTAEWESFTGGSWTCEVSISAARVSLTYRHLQPSRETASTVLASSLFRRTWR